MPPPMVHVLITLNFKIYINSYLSQNVIPLPKCHTLPQEPTTATHLPLGMKAKSPFPRIQDQE